MPLRWMYKPSKDGASPNAWSNTLKRLDVHYSSGPNNRMLYFLAKGSSATVGSDYYSSYLNQAPLAMTGIGTDKAFRSWPRRRNCTAWAAWKRRRCSAPTRPLTSGPTSPNNTRQA